MSTGDESRSTDPSSGDNVPVTAIDALIEYVDEGKTRYAELATDYGRAGDTLRAIRPHWVKLSQENPDHPVIVAGEKLFSAAGDELYLRTLEIDPKLDALRNSVTFLQNSATAATGSSVAVLSPSEFRVWLDSVPEPLPSRPDPWLEDRLEALADG
jgi:hypothetical protein